MATEEQADAARQALLDQMTTLEQRARDIINVLKGGIDVGQSGTLGDLALLDNANQIPQFVSSVLSEMQKYGLGVTGVPATWPLSSLDDDPSSQPSGLYRSTSLLSRQGVIIWLRYNSSTGTMLLLEEVGSLAKVVTRLYDDGAWGAWNESWDSGSTTVDSNGSIKEASPIFRLGSTTEDGQHAPAGAGTANSEAKGVTAKHVEMGVYRVTGAKGLAAEGWTVELPRAGDGARRCLVETETADDGVITVRVYSIVTDPQGNRVAHELIDIPDDTFIPLRLLMPTTTDDEGNEIPTTAEPQADITVEHLQPATYKLDIWDRMTDAEAETFETQFNNVGAKLRGMWRDCRYVDHESPLFSTLRGMMVDQWGESRADELLAPS